MSEAEHVGTTIQFPLESIKWEYERAVEYFKNFYQFGSMTFEQISQVLYHHGWKVRLLQLGRRGVWEFISLRNAETAHH